MCIFGFEEGEKVVLSNGEKGVITRVPDPEVDGSILYSVKLDNGKETTTFGRGMKKIPKVFNANPTGR